MVRILMRTIVMREARGVSLGASLRPLHQDETTTPPIEHDRLFDFEASLLPSA
jgi:hypothetical protein